MIKLTIESPKLLADIKEYLKENKSLQSGSYAKNLGIESIKGNVVWSNLGTFSFIEKLGYFDQVITSSIQCGSLYLVNKDGSNNKDTSLCGGGLTGSQVQRVWYNGVIQEFDSIDDGVKQKEFSDLVS